MATTQPSTTVVVVTWRGATHITACLDALAAQHRPHRTLVVDNASTDDTARLLTEHPSAPKVLRLKHNTGYAGAIAAALPLINTKFVAWLNDDTTPAPDWLTTLEDTLHNSPHTAATGSALQLPNNSPQSFGTQLTPDGHGSDITDLATDRTGAPGEVFGFCGGAALLRTEALLAVGGVPAGFFCYYEDLDTAWRLRLAGWDVLCVPQARAVHRHGASTVLGSPAFHRWNERNRLLMLVRCAPGWVALRELAKFAALTVVLPLRGKPAAANFRLGLRCWVFVAILYRLPAALRARRAIGRRLVFSRATVWEAWAGR